jgi:hypothetical protein
MTNPFQSNEEMADPAVLAQLQQLVGQLNALQQTVGDLLASNNTLTSRIATLEAENTTLTAANRTLAAQVQNLPGGAAAGSAAGGDAGAATLVPFCSNSCDGQSSRFDQLLNESRDDDLR